MKRITVSFLLAVAAFGAIAQGVAGQGAAAQPLIRSDIRICLDHENGQYALGETVYVTAQNVGGYAKELEMTVFRFAHQGETVSLGRIGSGVDTIFKITPAYPVAMFLEFRAKGESPRELPLDVELSDDSFRIGFIVGAETFRPGADGTVTGGAVAGGTVARADIRKFWADQVEKMRQSPIEAVVSQVPQSEASVECYDVEINGPDGVPVRGYLALPRGAAPGSLPIVINFHAAGVAGDWCRSKVSDAVGYASRGAICFDFNAHGMKNDGDEEYYSALENGVLRDYAYKPLEDKESYYFKNMILRAVRGLDYVTQNPAWNGRTVLVLGESQGGYQSAMLAGIDSRVTNVIVIVPAGVGVCGSYAGRSDCWPWIPASSSFSDYALANAPYYDAALLLEGCRAECLVEIGLIDTTCHSAEVFSGFNTVAGPVRYLTTPYRPHHIAKVADQYMQWWIRNVHEVREHAIDSLLSPR